MNTDFPLAGVIGWPVAHSRSPELHTHWLKRYGIKGAYLPLSVAPNDFIEVVRMMPRMGFVGANVTIPHKEAAYALCDAVSPLAERLRAVNTLVFRDEQIIGDNTDGYGFMQNIRAAAPNWQADTGPVAVLGAGGASRAVVAALWEAGARQIRISNRTRERAATLLNDLQVQAELVDWGNWSQLYEKASLAVNTTSLGMDGKDEFTFDLASLPASAIATDLIYAPLDTPFLKAAADRGAQTIDGLGMLLHQARPGFEAWFGHFPEVDDVLRAAVLG